MKKLFPLLSVLFLISFGLSQKDFTMEEIVKVRGIYKLKFSDQVINGNVYVKNNKQKIIIGMIKNGLKEGEWIDWYYNGVKQSEGIYSGGKENGKWLQYTPEGYLMYERNYKNGVLDGEHTYWENIVIEGKPLIRYKSEHGFYKDGKKIGDWKKFNMSGDEKIKNYDK
jgi:antitoxin component YwqK of YwqJK toxin-antitoxin module